MSTASAVAGPAATGTPVVPVEPAPAAPAAPAVLSQPPAVPTPVTPESFREAARTARPDAINDLLRPQPSKVAAPAVVPPAAPVAPVPPAAVVPPVQPPLDATVPTDPEQAAEFTKNWRARARDFKEAQFLFLTTKQNVSVPDAYAEVYGRAEIPVPAAAAPVAPPALAVSPTREIDAQIATLEAEVQALPAKIDEAIDKEADTKTAMKLQQESIRKERQLEKLKDQREATIRDVEQQKIDVQVANYQTQQQASGKKAMEVYPQLASETSEARVQFNLKVEELTGGDKKHPLYAMPEWPMMVARITAAEKGWTNGAAAPVPAPAAPIPVPAAPIPPVATVPPNPAPARATAAAVITPSATSASPAAFTPTVENFRELARNANPKDINKLLSRAPR